MRICWIHNLNEKKIIENTSNLKAYKFLASHSASNVLGLQWSRASLVKQGRIFLTLSLSLSLTISLIFLRTKAPTMRSSRILVWFLDKCANTHNFSKWSIRCFGCSWKKAEFGPFFSSMFSFLFLAPRWYRTLQSCTKSVEKKKTLDHKEQISQQSTWAEENAQQMGFASKRSLRLQCFADENWKLDKKNYWVTSKWGKTLHKLMVSKTGNLRK